MQRVPFHKARQGDVLRERGSRRRFFPAGKYLVNGITSGLLSQSDCGGLSQNNVSSAYWGLLLVGVVVFSQLSFLFGGTQYEKHSIHRRRYRHCHTA